VEVVGMTTPAIGGMAAWYQAADGGVAFGVGTGAGGTIMVRSVTVGATATERGIGEGVFDAPSVFEPRSERLIVSRLYVDQEALGHRKCLRFGEGSGAVGGGGRDTFPKVHVGMEAAAGLGLFETLTEGCGLTTPSEELVF
jgi:hypothetical protein